tara:strand:- start:859 stop:1566 length:708 start_codon:yes stop_codon:yes gene_type:complete
MTQLNDEYLKHIPINNPELLAILNGYSKLHTWDGFEKNVHLSAKEHARQRKFWVGDKHKEEILAQGTRHEGFPDQLVGYNLKLGERNHEIFEGDADPVFKRDFTRHLAELNDRMMNFLSVRTNALAAVYPPGGFISWHNNANASAYNLIFTWSEFGEGCFKYIHPKTKEEVICEDAAGQWTCKAAYFGAYGEEDKLLYHAAETDSWRTTVSYTFNREKESEEFREMVIADISAVD